jgi:hypothetical protein
MRLESLFLGLRRVTIVIIIVSPASVSQSTLNDPKNAWKLAPTSLPPPEFTIHAAPFNPRPAREDATRLGFALSPH